MCLQDELSVSQYLHHYILSYMVQNTSYVICAINTRHQMKKQREKFLCIYGYNISCIDNEEAAI